jgi:hypothetical protein
MTTWFDDLPVPGNVDRVLALARWCADVADGLDRSLRTVRRIQAAGVSWEGRAADAFQARLTQLPELLERAHVSYAGAAHALSGYADVLRDAQAQAKRAAGLAEDARENLVRLAAELRDLESRPITSLEELEQRRADIQHIEALQAETRRDLAAAERLISDAGETVVEAARRAASQLDRASHAGLYGRPLEATERPVAPRLYDVTRTAVETSIGSSMAALAATPHQPEVERALAGMPLVGGDLRGLAHVVAHGSPVTVLPEPTGGTGTVLSVPLPWSAG